MQEELLGTGGNVTRPLLPTAVATTARDDPGGEQTLGRTTSPNHSTLHMFEVFDAVLRRRSVTRMSISYYVQQQMRNSALKFSHWLIARYPDVRAEAEDAERDWRLRQPALARSGRLEVTFKEIHQRIAEVHDLTEVQSTALQQWELSAEKASVSADAQVVGLIKELLSGGHRVALVSDTYLPRKVVLELLEAAEPFLATLPLYVSSDSRRQKSTGALFEQVRTELGQDVAGWVDHSPPADSGAERVVPPGLDNAPVQRAGFDAFERDLATSGATYDSHLYAGMLRSFRVDPKRAGHGSARQLQESFVFCHVASYWVPYIDWVLRDALRRGYRTLYFIARDGYHLKRIADVLIAERGLGLHTSYVHGSRIVWRLAAQIGAVDTDIFEPHGDFMHADSIDSLLACARLDRETFDRVLPELSGLTDGDLDTPAKRQAVVDTLAVSPSFLRHLLTVAARERDLAVRYLRQEIDFGQPFSIVEFWGSGYTQSCLARLVAEAVGRPIDIPAYYFRTVRPTEGHAIRHRMTTMIQSPLFVEAVFANHPRSTVLGYREVDGRVEPFTRPREYNPELQSALDTLLPEHARRFAALEFVDPDSAARDIFRFAFRYYDEHKQSKIFLCNVASLKDAVGVGATEREFAPPMTNADLRAHKRGNSFRAQTHSIPLTLARSSEWVRVRYNFYTEPRGTTPTLKKAAILVRALVRTGMRSVTGRDAHV